MMMKDFVSEKSLIVKMGVRRMKVKREKKVESKLDPKALFFGHIESELSKKGVTFFDEKKLNIDERYLLLPKEVTDVTSRDLGEYLNAFTQQKMYMRTLVGRIEVLEDEAKKIYHDVSYPVYVSLNQAKLSETAKDRILNSHEDVADSYYALQEVKRKKALVMSSIENIEDAIFMLSREVTRRTGDFNEETRNHNVGRH
jgi:hypothetical protein